MCCGVCASAASLGHADSETAGERTWDSAFSLQKCSVSPEKGLATELREAATPPRLPRQVRLAEITEDWPAGGVDSS